MEGKVIALSLPQICSIAFVWLGICAVMKKSLYRYWFFIYLSQIRTRCIMACCISAPATGLHFCIV
jgi:hypothetical protein